MMSQVVKYMVHDTKSEISLEIIGQSNENLAGLLHPKKVHQIVNFAVATATHGSRSLFCRNNYNSSL